MSYYLITAVEIVERKFIVEQPEPNLAEAIRFVQHGDTPSQKCWIERRTIAVRDWEWSPQ